MSPKVPWTSTTGSGWAAAGRQPGSFAPGGGRPGEGTVCAPAAPPAPPSISPATTAATAARPARPLTGRVYGRALRDPPTGFSEGRRVAVVLAGGDEADDARVVAVALV